MSDFVSPIARAPVVGVYRFWRDMGYVVGGLLAGIAADAVGYGGAIAFDPRNGLVTTWRRDTTVYLASPGAAPIRILRS